MTPMHQTQPVYSLDLESLRRAGRFRDEGGQGEGVAAEGEKQEAGGEKPSDPAGRISVLVEERNAERQKAAKLQEKIDALTQQVDQLKGGEKVVADLQKQLEETRAATATRFDKLLEAELANLPESAANAVKAIPGGSEVQFDWLVSNRSLFTGSGGAEEKKGVEGPANERKPNSSEKAGASSVAKSYVDSRKPKEQGFAGLV